MFRHFFDPDRNWKSPDKIEHLAGGFVACMALDAFTPLWLALVVTVVIASAFELGQWDVARNGDVQFVDENGDPNDLLGHAGFGFGLLDLAVGAAGALIWALVHGIVALIG